MKSPRPASLVIARRELAAYFSGPIAYIVSGLFLAFTGFLFFSTFFLVNRAELRGFFALLPIMFAFFVPALTMRLFSEEWRSGSIETLLTLPVSSLDVSLGKFAAAFCFIVCMLLPTLSYVITATVLGAPDAGPIIGGYFRYRPFCLFAYREPDSGLFYRLFHFHRPCLGGYLFGYTPRARRRFFAIYFRRCALSVYLSRHP